MIIAEPSGAARAQSPADVAPADLFDPTNLTRRGRITAIPELAQPSIPPWVAASETLGPTAKPVDYMDWFQKLGFDLRGPTEGAAAAADSLWSFPSAGPFEARRLARAAIDATSHQFQNSSLHNNEADAFRHALWAFLMARRLGPDRARRFHDAHEISALNPFDERLMDVFNSRIGIRLALDPANAVRPAEAVIAEALKNGILQTRPVRERAPAPAGAR
jgi:hypothetical protein